MPGWEETDNEIRYRVQDPSGFEDNSFRRKDISGGVSLVLGKKKGSDMMEVQSMRFDKGSFDLEKAKKWWDSHKGSFSESDPHVFALPETYDVPGVEIFASGTWNKDAYTETDLDEMVRAFKETGTKIRPYLKLGHGEDQKLLKSDELPAAGWVTNLRREGRKLLADFTKVPKKIYELMQRAAYRRVSSEIYWNFSIDGKKYPRLLKAVALLGGETPAVHDLNDIMNLYSFGVDTANFASAIEPKTYEVSVGDLKKVEDAAMEELEQTKASLSEANKKLAEATTEIDGLKKKYSELESEMKKISDSNAALLKENSETKIEKKHAEIKANLDKLISDKKIVPAQKDALFTLLSNMPESKEKKYTLGDKTYSSLEEVTMAFVEAGQKALPTGGKSEMGEEQSKDLADKAAKYAEEHKVSFKEALVIVARPEKA